MTDAQRPVDEIVDAGGSDLDAEVMPLGEIETGDGRALELLDGRVLLPVVAV
jgi:hypothetical protein